MSMILETTSGHQEMQAGTNGAAHTIEQGLIAGERNPDSSTNGYLITRGECLSVKATVNSSVANLINAADHHLMGLFIAARDTTAVSILFRDEAGTGITTGAIIQMYTVVLNNGLYIDCHGLKLANGLNVQNTVAANVDVTAFYAVQ